jgi:sugar lactone lactonase YvrE
LGAFGDGTGHLWIVGKELILHSADLGKTWENQYLRTTPKIDLGVSGTAIPGGHAWIAVANFEIYRTDDYGNHWVRVLTTVDDGRMNFTSISFSNSRRGCAVGNSSFIYCTDDGGITWSRSKVFKTYTNGSPFSSKLRLLGSLQGWAGIDGKLYRTENGGHSFTEVLTVPDSIDADVSGETQALRTSINGPTELTWDKSGFLFIVESMQERLLRLNVKHSSIKVMVSQPENGLDQDFGNPNAVAADQRGNVFIADFNGRLRKMDGFSGETRLLLPADLLEVPAQMAVDAQGSLLVVDRHHKLYRWQIGAAKLETVAGTGFLGFGGDGASPTTAQLAFPEGVATNKAGDIFIADYQNCRIRKIDARTQVITTLAGTGECVSGGDGGPAISAALSFPSSIAVDDRGCLFIVEGGTDRVRRVDEQGMITTYAGTGHRGFSGDGGPADKATLNNPSGIAVDSDGNLYISEYVNNRIRRVDAVTHAITTIAGDGKPYRLDIEM